MESKVYFPSMTAKDTNNKQSKKMSFVEYIELYIYIYIYIYLYVCVCVCVCVRVCAIDTEEDYTER